MPLSFQVISHSAFHNVTVAVSADAQVYVTSPFTASVIVQAPPPVADPVWAFRISRTLVAIVRSMFDTTPSTVCCRLRTSFGRVSPRLITRSAIGLDGLRSTGGRRDLQRIGRLAGCGDRLRRPCG